MTNKTLWIAFVVIFIVAQGLGIFIHEFLLAGAYEANAAAFRPREEMFDMMWMMTVGGALTLFLFCYIFTKGYEGKGLMEGVRYGALMGLFLSIPSSVDAFVVYPLTVEIVTTWFVSGVLLFIIYGTILAAIYKPKAGGAG